MQNQELETMPGKKVFPVAEKQIEELKARIEKLEGQIKKERAFLPEEKEKRLKEEIKEYLKGLQETPEFAAPAPTRDEAKEIKKFPANQQVGALVSLVFEKGLVQAIGVARSLDNPAILDEFHDTLVDYYYKILVEKGILKSNKNDGAIFLIILSFLIISIGILVFYYFSK